MSWTQFISMAMALSLTSLLVVHALPHGRCWHHADIPVMIVNKEKRMVLDILTPINRAAVQLHRLSPTDVTPAVRLQLAHRMMRIHDRFEDTCYDHEWEDALAHKLCATHVRHAAAFDMLAAIAADTGALSNFTAQTRSVARCLTMQLDRVRRACHNHVTPWTPEHTMCDDVLADRACRWISPFAGMCDHRLRVHYGRANRWRTRSTAQTGSTAAGAHRGVQRSPSGAIVSSGPRWAGSILDGHLVCGPVHHPRPRAVVSF
jgi:hypothetical protein